MTTFHDDLDPRSRDLIHVAALLLRVIDPPSGAVQVALHQYARELERLIRVPPAKAGGGDASSDAPRGGSAQ